MAQNSVKRTVVLDGKVGSGFSGMVAQVLSFSDAVEQLGKKSADFLNKGLETYKDYETNMLAAQFALSSQYKNAGELNQVMEELGENAQQWAASTIFHTDDVSNAINEAAHAGWDLNKILTGIPQAMLIAQAGGLDLSQGLDYLIKMMNGTGTAFEDAGQLVDQWAMAANSSATNIGELGEAFLAMGSSARFADSTGELFTMLATLANVGTTGSQAGTALRSAIVRLIAPTTKADAAMSMLGADAEEIASVLADESVTKAAKKLEGLGFSAYKSNGELKPLTEVFSELYETTKNLDEASRNEIIAAIFPTRTIATAMALLEGAKNNYDGLYESITNSEGYAESGAEIMMSGLMGSTETLASKWEEFMRKVGEFTAPEVEDFNSALGGIVDTLNSFPDEVWNGFVGGLEALAAVGAGAGAFKGLMTLHGMLGKWGWAVVGVSFAVGALVGYIREVDRINWADKFGQMDLDVAALDAYMEGVHTKWEEEKEALDVWNDAINETLKGYETASTQLSAMLMTDVLTGKELTPQEKEAVKTYYSDLYTNALTGIRLAKGKELQSMSLSTENADAGTIDFLQQLITGHYDELEGELAGQMEGLGQALASALEDGMIDLDEQRVISEYVRAVNEIQAQIAASLREQDYYTELYKMQSLSWESAIGYIGQLRETRDKNLQSIDDEYARKLGTTRQMFDEAYRNKRPFYDEKGNPYWITEDNYEDLLKQAEQPYRDSWAKTRADEEAKYNSQIAGIVNQALMSGEAGIAWQFLQGLSRNADGTYNYEDAFAGMTAKELESLQKNLGFLASNPERIGNAAGLGELDPELAGYFENLFGEATVAAQMADSVRNWMTNNNLDTVPTAATESQAVELAAQKALLADYRSQLADIEKNINGAERRLQGFDRPWDYWLTSGENNDRTSLYGDYVLGKYTGGGLYDQREQVQLNIEQAEAEIARLEQEIAGIDGKVTFESDFTGIKSEDAPILEGIVRYKPIFMPANGATYVPGFANGGRADTPSIFGEAGAEWAIPESHDARTAELLNAARAASGFTWSELIARNGGLNGGGGSVTIQNYAPVIHARDAAGVGAALEADKERLKKIVKDAIRESRMMDNARMYA